MGGGGGGNLIECIIGSVLNVDMYFIIPLKSLFLKK